MLNILHILGFVVETYRWWFVSGWCGYFTPPPTTGSYASYPDDLDVRLGITLHLVNSYITIYSVLDLLLG